MSGSVIAKVSAIATNTAANTTITAVNSHQGYPKLSTHTLPLTGADNVSRARGAREQALPVVRGSGVTTRQTFGNGRITFLR